jgi:hypothetical protein
MKKSLLFVAASMFVLMSCKKDFKCDCSYSFDGQNQTSSSPISGAKKKDAQQACDDLEKGLQASDANASCELKNN